MFLAKKEVYGWLKEGKKTIDIRKGAPQDGAVASFQCGPYPVLRFAIVKRETGPLAQVIREDTFKAVIPTARTPKDACDYLQAIYQDERGVFTAYHLARLDKQ
jgi:ASC-1-like (ASCH) protein